MCSNNTELACVDEAGKFVVSAKVDSDEKPVCPAGSTAKCGNYQQNNQQRQPRQNQQGRPGENFQPGPGTVNPGGQQMPQQAGPGGCKGPEECKAYCDSNPDNCKNTGPNNSQFAPGAGPNNIQRPMRQNIQNLNQNGTPIGGENRIFEQRQFDPTMRSEQQVKEQFIQPFVQGQPGQNQPTSQRQEGQMPPDARFVPPTGPNMSQPVAQPQQPTGVAPQPAGGTAPANPPTQMPPNNDINLQPLPGLILKVF